MRSLVNNVVEINGTAGNQLIVKHEIEDGDEVIYYRSLINECKEPIKAKLADVTTTFVSYYLQQENE